MLRILSCLLAATSLMPTRQRGATLVEYVLIVAVIALAVFGVDQFVDIGGTISKVFTDANTAIKNQS